VIKKRFSIDVYNYTFTLVIWWDDDDLLSIIGGQEFNHPISEFDGGLFQYNEMQYIAIKAGCSFGTIAHESFHLMNRVMDYIGQIPDRNVDEADAYLLTWIVDEIHEFIELNKNKIGR